MLLRTAPISTNRFRYDPVENVFTAEASDLGPSFRLGRIYDDACDQGFTLVSALTGREVVFAHELTRWDDADEDILYDEFAPAPGQDIGQLSAAARVRIYND